MAGTAPSKTTQLERSKYWGDVRREAWALSRELFQVHHQVGLWIISAILIGLMRGWDVVMQDFTTTLLYTVLPSVFYLTLVLSVNFLRAIVRVPIYYYRETIQHVAEIAQIKAPQLQLELSEAELNFTSTRTNVFVRVKNLTALTIENVIVRIDSIEKIGGPEDSRKLSQPYPGYVGLPLSIRDAGEQPTQGDAPYEATIHAEDSALFEALQMHSTHLTLLHAKRAALPSWASLKGTQQNLWFRSPEARLPPGHYHMQLKAQGRNTPPARLTIEFIQSNSKRTVQQVEDVVPRETNSSIP